jgi:hypothetical protein
MYNQMYMKFSNYTQIKILWIASDFAFAMTLHKIKPRKVYQMFFAYFRAIHLV